MTLYVEDVTVRFGAERVLGAITLMVKPGERVGLIGPNGAGKTTLLNVINGLVTPASGRLRLDGTSLGGASPERVARLGVARTFQSPRVFAQLTVEQNVRAGRRLDVEPWIEWAGLGTRRGGLAERLSPGEARRLELARALASDPRVLLLDEPCGGLNPAETLAMADLIARAATPDRLTILVEHKLGVVRRLCDRIVVLHLGETIFDGPPAALADHPRVLEAYLGPARPP